MIPTTQNMTMAITSEVSSSMEIWRSPTACPMMVADTIRQNPTVVPILRNITSLNIPYPLAPPNLRTKVRMRVSTFKHKEEITKWKVFSFSYLPIQRL